MRSSSASVTRFVLVTVGSAIVIILLAIG